MKFHSFQFRLLHNEIGFNKQLKLWKVKNNDWCTFCQNEQENMLHFFVQCPFIVQLWQDVFQLLERKSNICLNEQNY